MSKDIHPHEHQWFRNPAAKSGAAWWYCRECLARRPAKQYYDVEKIREAVGASLNEALNDRGGFLDFCIRYNPDLTAREKVIARRWIRYDVVGHDERAALEVSLKKARGAVTYAQTIKEDTQKVG